MSTIGATGPLLCLGTTPTVQETFVFDRVKIDQVNRTARVSRAASGKSLNVARVLRSLGQDVCALLPLGGDTGEFIHRDLAEAGIEHVCVQTTATTRTCVTVVDRDANTATELVQEHEPLGAGDAEALLEILSLRITAAKMLILSGSLARGVGEDFYFRCLTLANEARKPAIVDASGPALARCAIGAPLVVKPNRLELAEIAGKPLDNDADLRQAMRDLQRQGPQWVVVTLGREGAVACDSDSFWKIPGLKIQPVSSIGSGDAFAAGLATSITAGQSVPDACRLATACAAANALAPGAGFLNPADVDRLLQQVRMEKWN
jgi:tagatose 6-phosphate kinase